MIEKHLLPYDLLGPLFKSETFLSEYTHHEKEKWGSQSQCPEILPSENTLNISFMKQSSLWQTDALAREVILHNILQDRESKVGFFFWITI